MRTQTYRTDPSTLLCCSLCISPANLYWRSTYQSCSVQIEPDHTCFVFPDGRGCTGTHSPANPATQSSAPTPTTQHDANISDGHHDSSRTCAEHKGHGDFQFKCSKYFHPSPLLLMVTMSRAGTDRGFHIANTGQRAGTPATAS